MAKTKTPFLSLGSRGTIGGSLTSQRRDRETIFRTKPIPTDPRTLAQAYQRWHYQDGIFYWNELSQAQRDTYRADASRYNSTPLAQFMKWYLRNLPDIIGMWPFDLHTGATTPDISKNENPGVIFGPLSIPGVIDGALAFDGVDDRVKANFTLGTYPETALTIEAIVYIYVFGNNDFVFDSWGANKGFELYETGTKELRAKLGGNAVVSELTTTDMNLQPGAWYHLAFRWDGALMEILKNGVPSINTLARAAAIEPKAYGYWGNIDNPPYDKPFHGIMDWPTIWSRALSNAQLRSHAARRYPLQ